MIDFDKDFEEFCKQYNVDAVKDGKAHTSEFAWCARCYVASTLKDVVNQLNSKYNASLKLESEYGNYGTYFGWK